MSSSNQYTVTINAVGSGAPMANNKTSAFGHVWYSISNGTDIPLSFGFAPRKPGDPFGPGKPNPHGSDDKNYLTRDYTRTIKITKEQYETLKEFGNEPEKYGFSTYYNGIANNCIDYLWKGLGVIGLNPEGFQGDIFPLHNTENFDAIKSTLDDPNATQPHFEQKSTPEKDGKTVAEWISDLADDLGATVAFLMKDAVKSASIASNSSNLFSSAGVSASEAVIFHLIVLSYIINLHIPKMIQNIIKIFFIHFLLANAAKLQKIYR